MTDELPHTTKEAARKRVAEWREDPDAQEPNDENDRSNEADVFVEKEDEE